ncbi:MAG: DUF5522 domain-containing protein [Candidatus Pacearchaeota archaeon]
MKKLKNIPPPHISRLSPDNVFYEKILDLHEKACRADQITYDDPETGFTVFTYTFLKNRGFCCENKCRHCPYIK